jgi:hypothetical protein
MSNEPPWSLSYEEIMQTEPEELKQLAEDELLDEQTLERIGHLGRFFQRIAELGPAGMTVGDLVTEDELQAVWRETADESARETVGHCPLIH